MKIPVEEQYKYVKLTLPDGSKAEGQAVLLHACCAPCSAAMNDVWHGMSCCCGCQFVPVVVEFGELSVNGNTRIFFAVHVQDLLGTFISGLISPPCHNQAGGITAAAI